MHTTDYCPAWHQLSTHKSARTPALAIQHCALLHTDIHKLAVGQLSDRQHVLSFYLISNMSRSLRHARVKRVLRRRGPLHAGAILPSSPSTFNGSVGAVVSCCSMREIVARGSSRWQLEVCTLQILSDGRFSYEKLIFTVLTEYC
jgi:hypothetical protein